MAIPKKKPGGGGGTDPEESLGSRGTGQYSYYYESYWADQAAWGNYASIASGGKQFIHQASLSKLKIILFMLELNPILQLYSGLVN